MSAAGEAEARSARRRAIDASRRAAVPKSGRRNEARNEAAGEAEVLRARRRAIDASRRAGVPSLGRRNEAMRQRRPRFAPARALGAGAAAR